MYLRGLFAPQLRNLWQLQFNFVYQLSYASLNLQNQVGIYIKTPFANPVIKKCDHNHSNWYQQLGKKLDSQLENFKNLFHAYDLSCVVLGCFFCIWHIN